MVITGNFEDGGSAESVVGEEDGALRVNARHRTGWGRVLWELPCDAGVFEGEASEGGEGGLRAKG